MLIERVTGDWAADDSEEAATKQDKAKQNVSVDLKIRIEKTGAVPFINGIWQLNNRQSVIDRNTTSSSFRCKKLANAFVLL